MISILSFSLRIKTMFPESRTHADSKGGSEGALLWFSLLYDDELIDLLLRQSQIMRHTKTYQTPYNPAYTQI